MSPCAPHAVVLGSGPGGLTAALELKRRLGGQAEVTVVAPDERAVFAPWLVEAPFSDRSREALGVPVRPVLEAGGVHVVQASATAIDPVGHTVSLSTGRTYGYDHLVVATGARDDLDAVPGLAEHGSRVTTVEAALSTREAWRHFVADPGDRVVVAAAPGTSRLGAAHELLFHLSYQLKRHGLGRRVRLTFLTAEATLGRLGLGQRPHDGELLATLARQAGIEVLTLARLESVERDRLVLASGTEVLSSWSLVVPPTRGQDVVAETPGLADARGLVPVGETFRSTTYDDVHVVGAAAAVDVPWTTAPPGSSALGAGFPVEAQARTAAADVAAMLRRQVTV